MESGRFLKFFWTEFWMFRRYGQLIDDPTKSVVIFLDDDIPAPDGVTALSFDQFSTTDLSEYSDCILGTRSKERLRDLLDRMLHYNGVIYCYQLEENSRNLPIFLVSPPKAGSHFLISLMQSFGYEAGGVLPTNPKGGHWYSLLHDSIHTSAKEFIYDRNRHGEAYGGRLSPFNAMPGLVIYRHPRDIFQSRLNYYSNPRSSIYGQYMSRSSPEDRAAAILEPQSLYQSIGDELADYVAWKHFPNIIPLSYEELIPASEGDAAPVNLVWRLQLKLQAEGSPEEHYAQSFGTSPTFVAGKVFPDNPITEPLLPELYNQCAYYMRELGYKVDGPRTEGLKAYREPHLDLQDFRPKDTPIRIKNTKHFDIFYLNQRYYARHRSLAEEAVPDYIERMPSLVLENEELEPVLTRVDQLEAKETYPRYLGFLLWLAKFPRLLNLLLGFTSSRASGSET